MHRTSNERVLLILPYPEPLEALNELRTAFPGLGLTYIKAGTADDGSWGKTTLDPSKKHEVCKHGGLAHGEN